jgi:hypothetical protein
MIIISSLHGFCTHLMESKASPKQKSSQTKRTLMTAASWNVAVLKSSPENNEVKIG